MSTKIDPAVLLELLRIGAQLLATMNLIKAQVEANDPVLWSHIAKDFNDAAAKFNGEPK